MVAKILWRAMRPSFLILTPACVALGASTALAAGQTLGLMLLILALTGAVSAHLCVNLLNEYYDFKSGLDLHTHKSPFNGGSGALPEHPDMALPVLGLGLAMLVTTITVGAYFIYQSGLAILLIGIMGLALIITYTQWLNRLPLLCLIAPGLGFGIFMVLGTHIVLAGTTSALALAFAVSLVPFFLGNNLLLLNQLPDIEADRQAGRLHFPIAFGIKKSTQVYIGFAAAAYLLPLLYIAIGWLPVLSLLVLLAMPLSAFAAYGMNKYGADIAAHLPFMAANAAATVLAPILLSVSLFIAA